MQIVRVFLSSPGDCKRERDAISQLVTRINLDPLVSKKARVEVVRWDWDPGVPMEALEPPQTSVNNSLPTPETCEVFVGLFRRRFGTPLPADKFRRFDGQALLSGTEYEFHRAWDARRKQYNLPHRIWIFREQRRTDFVPRTQEQRIQYERVESFFAEPPFRDGSIWTGSVHSFQAVKDLIQQLENNLRQYLSHVFPIGTLPLDDWCRSQGTSLIDRAGPRYSQNAHVETDVGKVFDWLLARPEAITEIDQALAAVWKSSQYESVYSTERERLGSVAQSLRQDQLWQDNLPEFSDLIVLTVLEKRAWEEVDAIDAKSGKEGKSDDKTWRHRQIAVKSRDACDLVKRYSALASKRILLLVGPAGQGKTHTLVHEVQRTLKTGGLALGVLCQELGATGAVWNDILYSIDYHDSVSLLLDAWRTRHDSATSVC